MSDIAIAVLLPPPHTWQLVESADRCPPGHAIVFEIREKKRRRTLDMVPSPTVDPAMASDLYRLIAMFARMQPEQREHLLTLATEMLEAERLARESA